MSKKLKECKLKTKEEARANLEASVSYIPERYKVGVGRADWATPAGSDTAEKNFADAMAVAISKKTRQLKVKQVSNSTWQQLSQEKGGAVIGERIRTAIPKQAEKWGPMYDRVTSAVATLPKRTLDFRANISNRVVGTVEAWKKAAGKL